MRTPLWKSSGDLIERILTRPLANSLDHLRSEAQAVVDDLESPAAYDQYQGREVPALFSRLYGPFNGITPRRTDANGFETLATLADPGRYFLPRNGSIKVGQIGTFVPYAATVSAYFSLTYDTNVTFDAGGGNATTPQTFTQAGDIFDRVIENNGGALLANNFSQFEGRLNFELGLYDRLRGRFLHDSDRLPSSIFNGTPVVNRQWPALCQFDPNSDIEPRLYVYRVQPGNILDGNDDAFNAALINAFFVLTLKGKIVQTHNTVGYGIL